MMRWAFGWLLLCTAWGCSGGPPKSALQNRTFYQNDDGPSASTQALYEQPCPSLDRRVGRVAYVGVSVLGGTARLSRPTGWVIRRASLAPGRRFIEYASPKGYLVALYERTDSPSDSWDDIQQRYEQDAKAKAVDLRGRRIPIATRETQGREYLALRTVRGRGATYVNTSEEVLLRGEDHVDLLEIVQDGDALRDIEQELLPFFDLLEVR